MHNICRSRYSILMCYVMRHETVPCSIINIINSTIFCIFSIKFAFCPCEIMMINSMNSYDCYECILLLSVSIFSKPRNELMECSSAIRLNGWKCTMTVCVVFPLRLSKTKKKKQIQLRLFSVQCIFHIQMRARDYTETEFNFAYRMLRWRMCFWSHPHFLRRSVTSHAMKFVHHSPFTHDDWHIRAEFGKIIFENIKQTHFQCSPIFLVHSQSLYTSTRSTTITQYTANSTHWTLQKSTREWKAGILYRSLNSTRLCMCFNFLHGYQTGNNCTKRDIEIHEWTFLIHLP